VRFVCPAAELEVDTCGDSVTCLSSFDVGLVPKWRFGKMVVVGCTAPSKRLTARRLLVLLHHFEVGLLTTMKGARLNEATNTNAVFRTGKGSDGTFQS
jgi:hypothetical protein